MLLREKRKTHVPLELDDDDDDYDDVGSRTTAARRGADGSGKHARLGLLDGSGHVSPAFVVRADDDDCDEEGSPLLLCVPTPDRRCPSNRLLGAAAAEAVRGTAAIRGRNAEEEGGEPSSSQSSSSAQTKMRGRHNLRR